MSLAKRLKGLIASGLCLYFVHKKKRVPLVKEKMCVGGGGGGGGVKPYSMVKSPCDMEFRQIACKIIQYGKESL